MCRPPIQRKWRATAGHWHEWAPFKTCVWFGIHFWFRSMVTIWMGTRWSFVDKMWLWLAIKQNSVEFVCVIELNDIWSNLQIFPLALTTENGKLFIFQKNDLFNVSHHVARYWEEGEQAMHPALVGTNKKIQKEQQKRPQCAEQFPLDGADQLQSTRRKFPGSRRSAKNTQVASIYGRSARIYWLIAFISHNGHHCST